jgi:hypothetical protein
MKPSLALAALIVALSFGARAMPGYQSPAGGAPTLGGTVLEVLEAGPYTYLRVKTKEGEVWSAVQKAPVKKGETVTLVPDTVMENFESKALNRKFDRVVFASLATPQAAGASPQQAGASPHGKSVVAAAKVGKVAKATASDAKTIEEVVAGRTALKGKTVTIRAQVVKVTTGVLNKNWVHLQDGSGSSSKGTHDLLVTTTDTIAVGDVVTAQGTVRIDVAIGPGYAYEVLVEDAKLKKS